MGFVFDVVARNSAVLSQEMKGLEVCRRYYAVVTGLNGMVRQRGDLETMKSSKGTIIGGFSDVGLLGGWDTGTSGHTHGEAMIIACSFISQGLWDASAGCWESDCWKGTGTARSS